MAVRTETDRACIACGGQSSGQQTLIEQTYAAVVETPIADVRLGLVLSGDRLTSIDFLHADHALLTPKSPPGIAAAKQLAAYFENAATPFDLPLAPGGTPFRQRVWQAMREIPVGETRTYGQLAQQLTSAARAVGGACGANPIPIVVPCHRVLATGGIGGFMGATEGWPMSIKRFLLQHEGVRLDG